MTAQSSRSWKKFVVLLVAFVGLPVLLFGVAPGALARWDDTHRVTVECTVERAAATSSSSRSLRGIGSTGVQVLVETSSAATCSCKKVWTEERPTRSQRPSRTDAPSPPTWARPPGPCAV